MREYAPKCEYKAFVLLGNALIAKDQETYELISEIWIQFLLSLKKPIYVPNRLESIKWSIKIILTWKISARRKWWRIIESVTSRVFFSVNICSVFSKYPPTIWSLEVTYTTFWIYVWLLFWIEIDFWTRMLFRI